MKRRYLLILSLCAMSLFLAVQVYLIFNIWRQKEEQLTLRYKAYSREALSLLVSGARTNGFEKPMAILNIFSGLIEKEELPLCETAEDSILLRRQAYIKAASIIKKNETLSSVIKDYIGITGNDTSFTTAVIIKRYDILNSGRPLKIAPDTIEMKRGSMVLINSFREERDNFIIEFDYYLNLRHKDTIVLSETIVSLSLIVISILVVVVVFWITMRNLLEERRLSELKTDFINNMTHELKTPLSTITVAGRALEKDQVRNDGDRVLETARMIGKQSKHLNQLINTILDVSLMERTEFVMEKREMPVEEVLHDIVSTFLISCNHCAVVHERYNCRDVAANIDLLHFTTMISNLLANAVKYATSEPVINLSAEADSRNLSITVSDNGIGIEKEHLPHIFEKFYRVPSGNIHKIKGLGLGLYYVQRIAEAHGGGVTVTSKPGKGTTFVINMPLR